ncbi:unnamed protein product [Rotaria sp. Silwood1]|nr:unnamed protein product [Rotaria sp. Silwood1]CAF1691790.1 unnamed protein product [Rotaria sp. Silwood1]
MNNDDHISYLWKSSLNISTKTQEKQLSNSLHLLNKNRRKSIIPSSHLPVKVPKSFPMDIEQDNSLNKNYSLEETEQQSQPSTNTALTSQSNNNYDNNDLLQMDKSENIIHKEETDDENSFDSFIIQNFT